MSNTPTTHNQQEEIDLGYLFKKLSDFFKKIVKLLFQVISFFIRFKIIVLVLIIIGVSFGIYKDLNSKKVYNHELIVIPNFESVDYLYSSLQAVDAKFRENDTIFLKKNFGSHSKEIISIEIEPIPDIYNFVTDSREKVDVFRILFQNQDLGDFVENIVTSKYYKYHKVNITTVGEQGLDGVIDKIFDYINANEHYLKYQEVGKQNTQLQIRQHERMISQIDSILRATALQPEGNYSVYLSETGQLHNLVETNQKLMENHLKLLKKEVDQDKIIMVVSANYNLPPEGFRLSNKVKYPLVLVFLFSFLFFIRHSYRKLKEIANQ